MEFVHIVLPSICDLCSLQDLIVWPNRIVVPLSPDPNFDYSVLEMRCVSFTPCLPHDPHPGGLGGFKAHRPCEVSMTWPASEAS